MFGDNYENYEKFSIEQIHIRIGEMAQNLGVRVKFHSDTSKYSLEGDKIKGGCKTLDDAQKVFLYLLFPDLMRSGEPRYDDKI